jgi:hypothetical protein
VFAVGYRFDWTDILETFSARHKYAELARQVLISNGFFWTIEASETAAIPPDQSPPNTASTCSTHGLVATLTRSITRIAMGRRSRMTASSTSGEPYPPSTVDAAIATLEGIPDVEVFGFNIGLADTSFTALLDNTPGDSVPVIAPGDTDTLLSSLRRAFTGLPIYQGRDVLVDPTVLRQPLRDTTGQTVEMVDNGFGPVVIAPTRAYLQRRSTITFSDYGAANQWSRRRWLHSLRGRQRSFWLPTWGRELVLQAGIAADDDYLIVAPDLELSTWISRHIMIDQPTGGMFRQITAASFDALGHRLTITLPGVDIPTATPVHVLTKMRLDADRIELEHSATRTTMSATVIEVPV